MSVEKLVHSLVRRLFINHWLVFLFVFGSIILFCPLLKFLVWGLDQSGRCTYFSFNQKSIKVESATDKLSNLKKNNQSRLPKHCQRNSNGFFFSFDNKWEKYMIKLTAQWTDKYDNVIWLLMFIFSMIIMLNAAERIYFTHLPLPFD